MATWNQVGLQDSSSPLMEQMMFFHDHTMLILIMITVLVGYLMASLFNNKLTNRMLLEGQTLETMWTIMPAITLVFIALPSLRLLYLLDEINQPSLTLKTIGHQWYWSYEYSDFMSAEFDSYMSPTNEMSMDSFRLLDVDNRTVLPINMDIRVLTTSADVLHSWAMPSMGIKMDATPGRLNQAGVNISRIGMENKPKIKYWKW